MNTNTTRKPHVISFRIACALGATIITTTVVGAAGTANAAEPRGQATSVATPGYESFGRPLAALGGRSLADYLADHHARQVTTGV
jgi:hypothetical protein